LEVNRIVTIYNNHTYLHKVKVSFPDYFLIFFFNFSCQVTMPPPINDLQAALQPLLQFFTDQIQIERDSALYHSKYGSTDDQWIDLKSDYERRIDKLESKMALMQERLDLHDGLIQQQQAYTRHEALPRLPTPRLNAADSQATEMDDESLEPMEPTIMPPEIPLDITLSRRSPTKILVDLSQTQDVMPFSIRSPVRDEKRSPKNDALHHNAVTEVLATQEALVNPEHKKTASPSKSSTST
jgi:uncharacterized coiled-coil protein SlyX